MNDTVLTAEHVAGRIGDCVVGVWNAALAMPDRTDPNYPGFVEAYAKLREAIDLLEGKPSDPDFLTVTTNLTRRFGGASWNTFFMFGSPRSMLNEIRMKIDRVGGRLNEPLTEGETTHFTAAVATNWLRPQTASRDHIEALVQCRSARGVEGSDTSQGVIWRVRVALFADFIPHGVAF